jgi:peptide chain release factor 1
VKDAIRRRLERVADRRAELERMLSDPAVLGNSTRFRELSMEFARVDPVARSLERLAGHERELAAARAMAEDPDAGLAALARQEVAALERAAASDEAELERMLVPADPLDDHNVFLEVRAAAGGDEAAIFAGDLFRMYARYAERRGWSVELVSESRGEHGGYREVISRIAGRGAYAALKFESGTHRVQRVPATESQGRIHTSAATVAVLPEIAEVERVEINPADLRTDTYRSSGAGGQHVNKTDSAVRITHIPTGIVVECQDERSQHKNRAKAMALLRARLLASERERRAAEKAEKRRLQVGTGDRSERIRTYNFPQGRLTDHRIELTLYRLDDIVDGDLDEVVASLAREHQAEELAALE